MDLSKIQKFDTIKQFIDYIPHCIICRKDMQHNMMLHCATEQSSRVIGKTIIPVAVVDDYLVSKKPKYNIKFDIFSNEIQGEEKVINFIRKIDITKYCNTCDLKILSWDVNLHRKVLAPIRIQQESLHYTLKGGRKLQIFKSYNSDRISLTIYLNNRRLPDLPFDFDKFVDLDQLNKRINTLLLFH